MQHRIPIQSNIGKFDFTYSMSLVILFAIKKKSKAHSGP